MFYYLISRYDKNGLVYDSNASLLAIIWGTWDDFWCNTSISGANNAGRAKNPPYIRRCLWLLLFGFCFYFTLINVLELINNYYQYPVDYSVTVQHKDLVSIMIWHFFWKSISRNFSFLFPRLTFLRSLFATKIGSIVKEYQMSWLIVYKISKSAWKIQQQ